MMRSALLFLLATPLPLSAQIRASENGSMSQTIDGTVIKVEYSRPRARGRDQLFGTKAVRWDETWTPGANWATTFEINKPVKVNGYAVATGKYSVWMKVREDGLWTFILDRRSHRYHMEPPDSSPDQLRIPVKIEAAPFTDVLTWSMPELRMDGGTLEMKWERVRVPLNVTVQPSLVMTFPAAEAPQYVGEYKFVEADSTGKDGKVSSFTISYEDNTLKARWTPDDPYMKKFALVRLTPELFTVGVYDQTGRIYEVLKPDTMFEFKRENGKVTGFTLRDGEDNLWGTGRR